MVKLNLTIGVFIICLVSLLLIPQIASADLSASLGDDVTTSSSDKYFSKGFEVSLWQDNQTQIKSDTIEWVDYVETEEFFPEFLDKTLYDKEGKLKVPLNNITFRVNQLESETLCTTPNQFLKKCTYDYVDFSDFESLNNITNKTITPVLPDFWESFWSMEWVFFWEFKEYVSTPIAWDVTFEGVITDLDPIISEVISDSSTSFYGNRTSARVEGLVNNPALLFVEFDNPPVASIHKDSSIYNNRIQTMVSEGYNDTCASPTGTGCYTFNTSNYIDGGGVVPTQLGSSVTQMSSCLWFKADTTASNDGIMDIGGFAGAHGEFAFFITGNKLLLQLNNYDENLRIAFSDTASWHQVCGVLDNPNNYFYLDGVLVNSSVKAETLDFSSSKTIIGGYYSSLYLFDGNVDNVQIWDRPLRANEVADLYAVSNKSGKYSGGNAGTYTSYVQFNETATDWNITQAVANSSGIKVTDICTIEENCVVYWPMDTMYSNDVHADVMGNVDLGDYGLRNITALTSDGMYFNGTAGGASFNSTIPIDLNDNNETSFSFWFKSHEKIDDPGANKYILSYYRDGNNRMNIWVNTLAQISFYYDTGASPSPAWNITDNPITEIGSWYHVAIAINSSHIYGWVNGERIGEKTHSLVNSGLGPGYIHLGQLAFGSTQTNSSFDELTAWNRTLTQDDVNQLYSLGLSQHANTNVTIQTRTATSYNVSDPSLVGLWAFNNDSSVGENGSLLYDYSDGHNNGTIMNNSLNTTEHWGIVGKGSQFNRDYTEQSWVQIPDSDELDLNSSFTMAFWVSSVGGSAGRVIVDKFFDGTDRGYALTMVGAAPWDPTLSLGNEAGSASTSYTFEDFNLVSDEINHIAVTWNKSEDGGQFFWYKDGVYIGNSTNVKTDGICDNTEELKIGTDYNYDPSDYWIGTFDEMRIYHRKLSATEIYDLYLNGKNAIDWTDWTTEEVVQNNVPFNNSAEGKFMQFRDYFRTNNTRNSPFLLNYSIGVTDNPTFAPSYKNTSFFAIKESPDSFLFEGTSYSKEVALTYNTSTPNEEFIIMASFNAENDALGTGSTEVYYNITGDNDLQLSEGKARTITWSANSVDVGAVVLPYVQYSNAGAGQHNISVWLRIDGTIKPVNISNFDISIGQLQSFENISIYGELNSFEVAFSDTTYQQIANVTLTKANASATYVSTQATINASATTTASCYIQDSSRGAEVIRYMADSSDTGSASGTHLFSDINETFNATLNCLSTTGADVSFDASQIHFDLVDYDNSTINSFVSNRNDVNLSSPTNYTAGINHIGRGNITYGSDHGDMMFLSLTTSFKSVSGEQTPTIIVNSSTNETNCRTQRNRYLEDDDDIANVPIYFLCEGNFTKGSKYGFDVFLEVPAGEEVALYSQGFNGFEVTKKDTSTLNTEPNVIITQPDDDANLTGIEAINWSVNDQQEDSYLVNVTAQRGAEQVNITLGIYQTESNTSWNTELYADGEWNISVTAYENETEEAFTRTITHRVILDNSLKIQFSSALPDNNVTGEDNIYLNLSYREGHFANITYYLVNSSGTIQNISFSNQEYNYTIRPQTGSTINPDVSGNYKVSGNLSVGFAAYSRLNDSAYNLSWGNGGFNFWRIDEEVSPAAPLWMRTGGASITGVYNPFNGGVGNPFVTVADYDFNFTGLSEGLWNISVNSTDSLGNTNSTITRTITIDMTSPVINITSPNENIVETSAVDIWANFTYTDATACASAVYSLNGAANVSNGCNNFTFNGSVEGSNTIVVCATDSAGNIGCDEEPFTLNTQGNTMLVFPTEETFSPTEAINITSICRYTNGTLCEEAQVSCRLTSWYPNNTILFNNSVMSDEGAGRYMFNWSAISTIGQYSSVVACYDGQQQEAPFTFTISEDDPLALDLIKIFPNNRNLPFIKLGENNDFR